MTVPLQRISLMLAVAALCAVAPAAGAQGASGGSRTREQSEAEQRRIEQVRRDLERAVERARDRIDALRERSEYRETEAQALRQAKIALERAEPATPEFAMEFARLQAIAAQYQATFFEDPQFKSAIKDMSRLQGELALRRMPQRQRGYLGVSFASTRSVDQSGRITFTVEEYPQIMTVEQDSPAASAGVRRGDVLLALNGLDLVRQGPIPLTDMLRPGEMVRVRVRREGRTLEVPVKVGLAQEVRVYVAQPGDAVGPTTVHTMPLPPAAPRAPGVRVVPTRPGEAPATGFVWSTDGFNMVAMLGAQLQSMDRDQRDVLDVDEGVVVINVQQRSLAAQAGLRSFDVVQRIDGERVSSPDHVRQAVARASRSGADSVVLTVVTKRKERKVTLSW